MSFLNKVAAAPEVPVVAGPPLGQFAALPALYEYLAVARYPDGSPRERSTMTVFCEDGLVKCCLSDRDQSRTLWRSGRSLDDAMLALETAIQDGSADWRTASGAGKRPAGRK